MIGKKYSVILKLLLVLAFSLNLCGASIKFAKKMNYETNYEQALKKAIKNDKPIMMVISTKTCPWCRKLENQTLKKNIINDIVAKEFIPLSLNKSKTQYPSQYITKVVPTIFFIDPKKEKPYHISYGYKNKKTFSKVITKAVIDYKSINQ